LKALISWIDHTFYSDFAANWDDQLFREEILKNLRLDMSVLDLGAGAGIVTEMNFLGKAQKVCGVDLDSRVEINPYLDEGRVSDAGEIPYPDASFDLVFSDNVLEHLADPKEVFHEVTRVLKPGGLFMFKTPNKWHYMPAIARVTPHWFHQYVNKVRGRAEVDTFPTFYRANTKRDLIKLAAQTGFEVMYIRRIEGRPEYLRMSPLSYLLGLLYERIVNLSTIMEPCRVLLVGSLKKK
jgi:ubiquinone/menaquinone biosynthesis C-methylase UbiE